MTDSLKNKRVAVLVTTGFEQSELFEPRRALEEAGAQSLVVSIQGGQIRGWKDGNWGDCIDVDLTLDEARDSQFDALMLPGGVINSDRLRLSPNAVSFVRSFFEAGKPVGAICHALWMIIEADVARGLKLTSWPSLQTDLRNAGAEWVDSEVVVDQGLVTSRGPQDLPAFSRKFLEEISEGRHIQAVIRTIRNGADLI